MQMGECHGYWANKKNIINSIGCKKNTVYVAVMNNSTAIYPVFFLLISTFKALLAL
jgi:hypothetical protein